MANNFLPFCATDTGTNLPTQGEYAADPNRPIGNQPGIASSKFNNKAIRQSTYVSSQVAQMMEDFTGTSILDDATPARFLSQLKASVQTLPPVLTRYTSGTGTHNLTYYFFIASGSATAGATYTNNTVTFTVVATVASGTLIKMTGNGSPTASGTLTKGSGTGDATLTFYAMRHPVSLMTFVQGAGGGGGGGGATSASNGTAGGDSSFGTSLITCGGGALGGNANTGGSLGGDGGILTVNSPAQIVVGCTGGKGGNGTRINTGGPVVAGASSYIGGAGNGSTYNAATNSGSGGAGGGASLVASRNAGGSGGAGAYAQCFIASPTGSYAYVVGAGGSAGAAGTDGTVGGTGGAGSVTVIENFQ